MAYDQAQKINKSFAPINAKGALGHAKRKLTPKQIALMIGFVIALVGVSFLLYSTFARSGEATATNEVRSVFSSDAMKDYSSPENKFTIMMPGFPSIKETTSKTGDKEIPITTYERVIENGAKNYTLAVYNYDGVQLDQTKALESALNSAIQNTPTAQLISTKTGKYNELPAIEGTYNVSYQDKIYESHIRYVMKDSKMYSMILLGGDQTKFDEFANSLRLN